jgi:hypothetical protein
MKRNVISKANAKVLRDLEDITIKASSNKASSNQNEGAVFLTRKSELYPKSPGIVLRLFGIVDVDSGASGYLFRIDRMTTAANI